MRIIIAVIIVISIILFYTDTVIADTPAQVELSDGSVAEVSFMQTQNGYRYEVVFERGNNYFYEQSGTSGFGGGTFTNNEMDLAEESIDIFDNENDISTSDNDSSSDSIVGILLILAGLFGAFFPYAAWYLEIGWKFDKGEPSDFALFANRASGIIISIVGIIVIFI